MDANHISGRSELLSQLNFSAVVPRFLGFVALLIAAHVPGIGIAAPPAPFSAVYDAKSKGFVVGTVQIDLKREASGEYIYRQTSATQGLGSFFSSNDLTETSRLRFEAEKMLAIEYRSSRKGGDNEENARFVFDQSTQTIRSLGAGEAWSLALSPGIIDPLMVRLALMVDLAGGSQRFEYQVPRQKRLKTYTFRVVGREKITVGQKTYDTIKVARTDDKRDQTWLWHAPSLGYLPVRILKDKKRGADTEVLLREVTITPVPIVIPAPPNAAPKKVPRPSEPAPPIEPPTQAVPDHPTKINAESKPEAKINPKPTSKSAALPSRPSKPAKAPIHPAPITIPTPIPTPRTEPTPSSEPLAVASTNPPLDTPQLPPRSFSQQPPQHSPQQLGHTDRPNDPITPAALASPPRVRLAPRCPSPRRIGKSWHWVHRPIGDRCVGRLTLPGTTSPTS